MDYCRIRDQFDSFARLDGRAPYMITHKVFHKNPDGTLTSGPECGECWLSADSIPTYEALEGTGTLGVPMRDDLVIVTYVFDEDSNCVAEYRLDGAEV